MRDGVVGRGRGRMPTLTATGIADAALELAAESSAGGLTMQLLAERLGVRHSALYRHVASRQDLLRLVADRHVELMGFPDPDGHASWRSYLTAVWAKLDEGCARYPGLAEAVYGAVWPPPRRAIEGGLGVARALIEHWGFAEPDAMLAADLILDFAIDARARIDRIQAHSPSWSGFRDAEGTAQSELGAAFDEHLAVGPDEWTRAKLDVLLDGLAMRKKASSDKV